MKARIAIVGCVGLMVSAAALVQPHVVVLDSAGWPGIVTPSALSDLPPATPVWLWSPECAAQRLLLPLPADLPCPAAKLEVTVTVAGEKAGAGVVILAAPAAMREDVPDEWLPRFVTRPDGTTTVLRPPGGEVWLRAASDDASSEWQPVPAGASSLRLTAVAGDRVIVELAAPQEKGGRSRIQLLRRSTTGVGETLAWGMSRKGEITIPPIPRGVPVTLVVVGEDSAPLAQMAITGELPVRLAPPPGVSLNGRVHDPSGLPLESAEVRAVFAVGAVALAQERATTTGVEGTFELTGLPPDRVVLTVSKTGFVPVHQELDLRHESARQELVMVPGRVVSVEVVAAVGGEPIQGATVEVCGEPARVRTGARGEARLEGVPRGAARLRVEADGFVAAESPIPESLGELVRVKLAPAASLRGRFLFADTRAPAGPGLVVVQQQGGTIFTADLPTSGELDLQNLVPGRYRVEVAADGATPVSWDDLDLVGGRTLDLHAVELLRGLTITGLVLDDVTGDPVVGCRVRTLRPSELGARLSAVLEKWVETATDAKGTFRLAGLEPGVYAVLFEAPGLAPQLHEALQLTADLPGGALQLDTVLLEESRTLAVECSPAKRCGDTAALLLGSPANDWATVSAPVRSGDAQLKPVPTGTGTLRLLDGGFVVTEREVRVERNRDVTRVEVSLAGVKVEGDVVQGGSPVPGGTVRLTPGVTAQGLPEVIVEQRLPGQTTGRQAVMTGRGRTLLATVDGAGHFSLQDVPAGTYELTYRAADGWETPGRDETIPEDTDEHWIRIEVGAGRVVGAVVTPQGRPPRMASATATDSRGHEATTRCNPDGSFVISGLAPGSATVSAVGTATGTTVGKSEQTVEISPEEAATVRLVLEEGEKDLTVAVRSADGLPATSAMVMLECGGSFQLQRTDAEGIARFSRDGCSQVSFALYQPGVGFGFSGPVGTDGGSSLEYSFPSELGSLEVSTDGPMTGVGLAAPNGFPLHRLLSSIGIPPATGDGLILRLDGLPPGRYVLLPAGSQTREAVVRGGDLTQVEL